MNEIPSSLQKELMEWLAKSTTNGTQANQSDEPKPKKEPVEKIIHRIATENRKLFYDRNNNCYIEVQDEKQLQNINKYLIKVASEEFNEWITHECFTNYYKTPTNQQLKGLKRVVTREAQQNGEKTELFNRVGYVDGAVYINLGTPDCKIVKVDANGIEVGNYSVYFQRHPHMEELPVPVLGGDLKDLLYYFPPMSEHEQCLVLCWLVASFIEHIQRPFLLIEGAPGTGKTTLGLILKSFIDPMENAALSYNENENEVAQIIDHQFLPFFDNLTTISRKLSNLMCRAYSGGSHLKKELYTDDKDFILKLSGNMILTAIKLTKPQNDFLQRCYKVVIDKTNESNRSREQFAKEFELAKPKIFGALLDTLSKTLAAVQNTPFNNTYRTGDFDRYAAVVAEVIGYGADFFWEARAECEQLKHEDIIQNTPIINGLMKVLENNSGTYKGFMTELHIMLKSNPEIAADIPPTPNTLSRRIGEMVDELSAVGIKAERKYNDGKGRIWYISLINTVQVTSEASQNQASSDAVVAATTPVQPEVSEEDQPSPAINPFLIQDEELPSLQDKGLVDTEPVSYDDIEMILKGTK